MRLSSFAEDGKSQNPFHDENWRDATRVVFMGEDIVKPGEIGTFIFDITAPKLKKLYRTQYRLTIHDQAKGIDGTPLLINDGKDQIIATTTVR